MRKKIPTGSVFHKSYRDKATGELRYTKKWSIRYYVKGKPITLPSGTKDYDDALALLRQKMATASRQAEYSEHPERVRMDQLFDLILEDYRLRNRHTLYDVTQKIESRLRPFFGDFKAQNITSSVIRQYITDRRHEKPANGTINRELACVRRALNLGAQQDPPLVLRVPHFEMLPEENVREGVLEHASYRSVREMLPSYARIALVIAYHTGARKGEIRKIQTDRIDFKAGRISLPGITT